MESRPTIEPFPAAEREKIAAWLAENGSSIPSAVRIALEQHATMCAVLAASQSKRGEIVRELWRALGLIPSSEKQPCSDPLGAISGGDGKRPRNEAERLQINIERLEHLSDWHRDLEKRHRGKMKKLKEKLEKLPPVEEIELTPEEMAATKRENKEMFERMACGEGPTPALQSTCETLMTGAAAETTETTITLTVSDPPSDEGKVVDTFTEERTRHDFKIEVGRIIVGVEKKIVVDAEGNRTVLSASTEDIGPSNFTVTWGLISNVAIMVTLYAIPMHRLGRLLSTPDKKFTAASLARILRYVAERLVPIYLHLFEEIADASVITGDDTSTRVLEVRRYLKIPDPKNDPPWNWYRTAEVAEATAALPGPQANELEVRLSRELGFEFQRRDGRGPKTELHTTAISGRSEQSDPCSLIVFYRSHFGGLGNLLEVLLRLRKPTASSLTVQSDLSPVNRIHDDELLERFLVTWAGCSSHARRPFSIHRDDDPDRCEYMLHLFKGLAIHERGLDLHGRNEENVAAVRNVDSRATWEHIRDLAQDIAKDWSSKSKLGDGARYIINHFQELTVYLDDVRLAPTNNFSERILRTEKLIESSAMFRATLGGRFTLDIVRTILQTAVAARAPVQPYLESVLRTTAADIEASPELYTPRAWTRRHLEQ